MYGTPAVAGSVGGELPYKNGDLGRPDRPCAMSEHPAVKGLPVGVTG
jgi:hypothetical protein